MVGRRFGAMTGPRMAARTLVVMAALISSLPVLSSCTTLDRWTRMPVGSGRQTPPPQLHETARKVGERAPGFTLPGTLSRDVELAAVLADGPAVLIFYRGDW